jgi:hypothetical protein
MKAIFQRWKNKRHFSLANQKKAVAPRSDGFFCELNLNRKALMWLQLCSAKGWNVYQKSSRKDAEPQRWEFISASFYGTSTQYHKATSCHSTGLNTALKRL